MVNKLMTMTQITVKKAPVADVCLCISLGFLKLNWNYILYDHSIY